MGHAECANCARRFLVGPRPAAFCSAACGAEAAAVRFGRRQRAVFGDGLPASVRSRLHRMVMHAVLECEPARWPGGPVPVPPQPDIDDLIPEHDVWAGKVARLRRRVLSEQILRPCDAANWDSTWRGWVRRQAS